MVLEVNTYNFEKTVNDSDKLTVVDFWAEWCGPCRTISPILDELSSEYSGKINVVKCNIDESPEIAKKFGIRSIPYISFFKNGKQVDTMIGAMPKAKYKNKIDMLMQ